MEEIKLKLPIKIKEAVTKDGYIIIDANDVEHFFDEKEKYSEEMIYDGNCTSISSKKTINKRYSKLKFLTLWMLIPSIVIYAATAFVKLSFTEALFVFFETEVNRIIFITTFIMWFIFGITISYIFSD